MLERLAQVFGVGFRAAPPLALQPTQSVLLDTCLDGSSPATVGIEMSSEKGARPARGDKIGFHVVGGAQRSAGFLVAVSGQGRRHDRGGLHEGRERARGWLQGEAAPMNDVRNWSGDGFVAGARPYVRAVRAAQGGAAALYTNE